MIKDTIIHTPKQATRDGEKLYYFILETGGKRFYYENKSLYKVLEVRCLVDKRAYNFHENKQDFILSDIDGLREIEANQTI